MTEGDKIVECGDVRVDFVERAVRRAGTSLHPTPIEYRLLTHLAAHPHCALTHRQLLNAVWGANHTDDTQRLGAVEEGVIRKSASCPLVTGERLCATASSTKSGSRCETDFWLDWHAAGPGDVPGRPAMPRTAGPRSRPVLRPAKRRWGARRRAADGSPHGPLRRC